MDTKFEPGDLVQAAFSLDKSNRSLPANSIIVFRHLGKMFPDTVGVGELLLQEHGGLVFFPLATAKVIVHAGDT
jgi:hypothetical protein